MTSDQSPRYADAIAGIESGGNYQALGPSTKSGDRALGKYQIMSGNIGPWSREVLGQEVTPDQFLANPQLQDAIFQGKFGQYVDKYGPEGAAKAWFAGERGMNNPNAKDSLGTSVSAYGAKFMNALGTPQGAPLDITPQGPMAAPQMAPAPSQPMPAYGWSPQGGQQIQAPAPMAQPNEPLSLNPINYAQRRPPDLTQLQAFLQRSRQPLAAFSFSRT